MTLVGWTCNIAQHDSPKKKDEKIQLKYDFARIEGKFDVKLGVFGVDTCTKQTVTYSPFRINVKKSFARIILRIRTKTPGLFYLSKRYLLAIF